jgi:hypothetical protein
MKPRRRLKNRFMIVLKWIPIAGALILLSAAWAPADNPQTDRSDKNYDTAQPNTIGGALQKTKDGANRGLNKIDKGLHSGGHKIKKGANVALQKVDDSIHTRNKPS